MATKTIIITALPNKQGTFAFHRASPVNVAKVEPRVVVKREAGSVMASPTPRKRERLTHLTADEKLNRRKLKNRIAAQTARDRKKLKMHSLEESTESMHTENETLLNENEQLREENDQLLKERETLMSELDAARAEVRQMKEGGLVGAEMAATFGSAEGTSPVNSARCLSPSLPSHDALDAIVQQLLADYTPPDLNPRGDAMHPQQGTPAHWSPDLGATGDLAKNTDEGAAAAAADLSFVSESTMSSQSSLLQLQCPRSPANFVVPCSPSSAHSPIPPLTLHDLNGVLKDEKSLGLPPIHFDAGDFALHDFDDSQLSSFLLDNNDNSAWPDTFTDIFQ